MEEETDFSYGPICKMSIIRTSGVTYYFDWLLLSGEVWEDDFGKNDVIHVDNASKRM